jgi:raffinose/stachyose/melibiose transport system substrate-binding protein
VFEHLVAMIDGGCFSDGASGVPLAEMVSQFATGQAAMMFTSSILQGQVLAQTPDLDIGVFPPPGDTAEDTRVTAYPAGGLGIWAESDHVDAAKLFLEFVSQEDVARPLATANGIVSSADATAGLFDGLYADLAPYFEAGQVVTDITTAWPNTQMGTLSGQSIQGLLTGQKTVDEVLADMDDYFERT